MERLKKVGKVSLEGCATNRAERIGIGFEKLDRAVFEPEKAYDYVGNIGLHWVRIQSGWARTETEKGVYHFEWLDSIVDNLVARNLEPWICLCYGNPVYTPHAAPVFGAVGCPPIETEEEKEAWRNYVAATVARYRGKVRYFEVWNEPDMKYSWKHSWDVDVHVPNAEEYGRFCVDTANVIHATNPDAKVIGLAISHSYDLTYISTAFQQGLADCIDAVAFHVYAVDDALRPVFIKNLRALVDQYNPNIELIQGEAGAQTRGDGAGAMHSCAWTPEKQTKYLLRGTLHDLACNVKFSSYFTTMDMIEAQFGKVGEVHTYLDYGYFGVLSADFDENGVATGEYKPKPSYTAFQTLCEVFRGDYSSADLPMRRLVLPSRWVHATDCTDTSVFTYGFRRPNGSAALAYWNSVLVLSATYTGTISFEVACLDVENIRLVDLATGDIYEIPEKMKVDKGHGCIELVNLPLTDSPLLLTFGDFLLD
jgi:hypothetical protein